MESKFFNWDKEFVTGHQKIDEQHYGLIETINHLMQLSFQINDPDDRDINTLKWQLTDYTVAHFKTEEDLMDQCKIDPRHKDIHKKVHEEFVNRVKEYFKSPLNLKDRAVLAEINEFLIRWLAYHILSMDKSMVRQIKRINDEGLSPKAAYDYEIKEDEASTEPLLKALKSLFFLVSQKNAELEEKVKERTTELQEANEKLKALSLVDDLTEIPNRRYVMEEINKLIQHWKRYGTVFAVMFLDLDKFKAVNDSYGHDAGDQVLIWVSKFIKAHIREGDMLCRLGGDEFVIVAPHTSCDEAHIMASNLLRLTQSLKASDHLPYWKPSFSIGVVEMKDDVESASHLLTRADDAMYASKRKGGGVVTR